MGFKYLVKEHAKKGMMVQMFQSGILKMNHLVFNEFFKRKGTYMLVLGVVENHMLH